MAKKAHTDETATAAVPASILDHVLTDPQAASRTVRFGDLPFNSQSRIIDKAVNELLNDATAFAKDALDKIKDKAINEGQDPDAAVAAAKAEKREQRWNSLLTGEFVSAARGPRGSKRDTIVREVALVFFTARWNDAIAKGKVKAGTPFPKGDKLKEWLAKETNGPNAQAIQDEADRRMATPTVSLDDDMGDDLGL